jgi:K+-sensing histidine kinase KdpD
VISFASGLAAGCLMGVGATFILLLLLGALSDAPSKTLKQFSLAGIAISSATILIMAALFYEMHMPKYVAMLLFLCVLLLIARQGVLLTSTICSGLATIILSWWFFPPTDSILVAEKDDRLALILFFVISIVVCQLISVKKRIA